MNEVNKKIQKHFNTANELALKEVERLAMEVLRNNPKKVSKFMMAMGSYFFDDTKGEIIHTCIGGNDARMKRLKGYNKLVKFIDKWDEYFGLTGTPMTFTANGKKVTDW